MITAVAISVGVVAFLYAVLVLVAFGGIRKSHSENKTPHQQVSVVVAFRNEKNNLNALIQSLQNQSHAPHEIILVNDHSTDLQGFVFPQGVKVISNSGEGKKSALVTGVHAASGQYIIFTDADCTHSPQWLQQLTAPLNEPGTGMTMGAVVPSDMRSFFAFDDLSIAACSIGLAHQNLPFACSGASMACRKTDFMYWNPYQDNTTQASGDDVYLMQACIRRSKKIKAVSGPSALVFHPAMQSLGGFMKQRMRWGQKTGLGTQWPLVVGLLVFLYSLILYAGLALCLINLKAALICMVGLILGAIVNFLFLFLVALRWKLRPDWLLFFPAFIFHLGYIPWAALLGKIWPLQWKGRSVKSSN